MILVTGGSGFIGANFILNWLSENEEPANLDKLIMHQIKIILNIFLKF